MRCKHCGWPNKPNETNCVKCHMPLGGDDEDNGNVSGSNVNVGGKPLNKTVPEGMSNPQGMFNDIYNENDDPQPQQNQGRPCPKCGYPLRPGSDKCPQCNYQYRQPGYGSAPVNQQPTEQEQRPYQPTPQQAGGPVRHKPTRLNEGGVHRGTTVNVWLGDGFYTEPSFTLKPMKRYNERHEFEEHEYEGQEVVLNRANTEENNASITSRRQAVVTNENGHWYIEDQSEQQTTFVRAGKKIELHDGDIILLGNRLFEFHE